MAINMKKLLLLLSVLSVLSLAACKSELPAADETPSASQAPAAYEQIDGTQAKEIMDTQSGYIIIDARTQEEFDQGHIPGAILIPEYEVASRAEKELTDKEQLILVYCRSGRRSKIAAQALADLGYTNVKEFGGIINWEYPTVKE